MLPRRPLAVLPLALGAFVHAQQPIEVVFPAGIDRVWAGPELYANRLQDWRVRNGRLECVESAEQKPMRVAHLLTASLGSAPGELRATVRVGPVDPASGFGRPGAFCGFLLGAGSPSIDYRLTALCHHRPAEDGGIVCAIDGSGRCGFFDNETNVVEGNWGIAGKLHPDELRELPADARDGEGFVGGPAAEVQLELRATPAGGGYRLELIARGVADGRIVSRATREVAPKLVDGSIAVVSHFGPEGSPHGYGFRGFRVDGAKVEAHPERAFGPILGAQYTLSRGTLKLTAQMPPLGADDTRIATLEVRPEGDEWVEVAAAELTEAANTFAFRVDGWRFGDRDVPYRVVYDLRTAADRSERATWTGTVREEPHGDEVVVAAFTGNKHFTGGIRWNHGGVWFPHAELVAAVAHHDPDLLFFSGDQIYEGDLTGVQRRPLDKAVLDYHDKWFRWVWAFRELTRDRPTVTIPDDHDVYHGNVWGAGGRAARRQDDGGYTMPAEFVRMVEATQTSHLPDPFDPTPVEQGIGVYYTSLEYGGVSFAILEDRKFKSSPTVAVPEGRCVNGWFQNPDFDPATGADVDGAVLLGERQLRFLDAWAADWSRGIWMKAVLSQTIFANVATLPRTARSDGVVPGLKIFAPGEYAPDDVLAADADSNGWPQTGRNEALRRIRKAFAVHIAGDQHLASMVHYGIDAWGDAAFALCVPSIGNTWPRRWFPPPDAGFDREEGAPPYTGKFRDGFGNRIEVFAVANPVRSGHEPAALHDRQPGYGIVRFRKASREIVLECWPRYSDPSRPGASQYPGWPKVVRQTDNYGREPAAFLPELEVIGTVDPVVQVVDERTGEIQYTLRIAGRVFRPWTFAPGAFTVRIGAPGTPKWTTLEGLRATVGSNPRLQVRVRSQAPSSR